MGTLRVHLKEIRSITQMRAKICLLAALSLAFNQAQVESGCRRSDPCRCEMDDSVLEGSYEPLGHNAMPICGCNVGGPARNLSIKPPVPGCQLDQVEYEFQGKKYTRTNLYGAPNICRSNATADCRHAIEQWAKEYPDTCKETTMEFQPDRPTEGAWAKMLVENCLSLTSGSGSLKNWPFMFLFMGACLWAM